MDCEQLNPLYEEYALGILEGEERAEMEAHLARACPQCMPGVAKARFVVAQLALAAPEMQPPAALRGKIMDAAKSSANTAVAIPVAIPVAKPSAPRTLFPVWAWIAAAALALVTGYTIRQMGNQNAQLAELRKQMRLATLQSQALQNQIEQGRMVASVMMSPDSKSLKLMPTKDKNMPMVHAYLHPHMGVAITADEMPAVSPGRTLQLWFVPKNGMPVSAAIFRPGASGQIALVAPVTVPMDQIAALAVTEEPAGGSPQPTSAIAWMAQVN
ncbi:MAG: anti-sigma factor [Candidatus Acidiferrales bacterium]|jgi:anti-sigma-K factor RskA